MAKTPKSDGYIEVLEGYPQEIKICVRNGLDYETYEKNPANLDKRRVRITVEEIE